MGRGGAALGCLALILAAAPGGAPSFAAAPFPGATYRLEARDGTPGAVHASFTADRPGRWSVSAAWSGRTLANLRVENAQGRVVKRVVGPSPLAIEILLDELTPAAGAKFTVRFAPTTDRGVLKGELRVTPPAAEAPPPAAAAPAPPRAPAALNGPGVVMAAAFGPDSAGVALRDLAQALETARPDALAWTRRWAARAASEARGGAGGSPRDSLDRFWNEFLADAPPDKAVGAAFRRVLAGVEDLARREARAKDKGAPLRARREAVLDALGRLGAAPDSSAH